MLSIFLLSIGFIYAIKTPVFQTWIVQRVAGYLSSELNTTVSLDHIEIQFFRTVSIKGLYIEDLHHDTLLYAGEISSVIDMFAPGNNKIYLSGIELNDGTVKLQKYKNEKGLNIDFLIDYFSSTNKDTVKKAPFDFNPGEIKLNNIQFVYRDNRYDDVASGIDFDDIRVTDLAADIDDIRFEEDTMYADIENLAFKEKSGFKVEYMETTAKVTPRSMEYSNLLLKTDETNIQGNISFNYDDINDFEEFVDKVKINSSFDNSELSSNDLVYFAKELEGLNETITISGKIKGTISQLKGRNLEIAFADHSSFKGDISISGLPDFEESYFDLVVKELITDNGEIESIPEYPFTRGIKMTLPPNLEKLGKVRFSGKFTGFLNDFVAYGNANTALGYLSSDINLKLDTIVDKSSFSGHLSATGFDVGAITNNSPMLGKTTFKANVSGKGLTLEKLKAQMEGEVTSLELNGYNYKNIVVNGQFAKKLFNGSLNIHEENLGLDFKGTIDLSTKLPTYNFTTEIKNAYLSKLNIIHRDSTAVLSTTADIRITGKDLDNATGYINIDATRYIEINDTIDINNIKFTSYTEENSVVSKLRSDLVDFDLTGSFRRTTLFKDIEDILTTYIPTLPVLKTKSQNNLELNYNITFNKTENVFKVFYPEIRISKGTNIQGVISKSNQSITLSLLSDSLRYSEAVFSGIKLKGNTAGQELIVSNSIGNIEISDTLNFVNVLIAGSTNKTKSTFTIATSAIDSSLANIKINGEADYLEDGQTKIKILPSEIKLNGKLWDINQANSITINSSNAEVANFDLTSGIETVSLNGKISADKEDHLKLMLKNFNTEVLNPLLLLYDVSIGGIATGQGDFAGLLSKPGISSDMFIKDLTFYSDTLGDATINFNYNLSDNIILVNGLVDRGGVKNIEVDGRYYILNKNDSLDFNITLQKTNLTAFAGYAKGLVSDVKGKASGTLKISGPVKSPDLTGKIRLQQTSFVVDYLNTRYNFSDEVEFDKNYFRFKNFTVNDLNGNTALVDGYVYHQHLKNFTLLFDITANKFQALNTVASQNELYYGKAYVSGKVKIFGPLDLIKMNLAVKTEKNTEIFIPLSNPEEVSKSSFINFVSPGINKNNSVPAGPDFSGIELDFDLEVTPDAEVQLIFDSKIGDIIKGKGQGDIKMNINTQGDFKMYGNYQVTSGDYLFTLQNLINKKFIIKPGGTISWSGSPYDATIDIEGIYKLRASLYDLFQDTTYKKRVPVEVLLSLKDQLFNPTIKFDIKVPDIDPIAETQINRYISTEEEISRQTMSLLVLNRFSKPREFENQGVSSSSAVNTNAAELLSQQLSNWASQISTSVNVGVNYRAADAFSQEELEVALSTQLFNDRVAVDGNFGYANNNQNTSNLVGDFNVEVKVSKDGKLRFKAFNKTINNSILNNYNSPYTQGIGIFYQEEFNNFNELVKRFRDKFRKKEDPLDVTAK